MADNLTIDKLDAIVFDFDGVLTDDRVFVSEDGSEMVCCSRRDGLAFDALRKTHLKLRILSTETNPVVARRAEKLNVPVLQGSGDKSGDILRLSREEEFDLARTLYVGNDLNDLSAIRLCGFSACPADAHPAVRSSVTYCLSTAGGHGVVREIVEGILQIDLHAALSHVSNARF